MKNMKQVLSLIAVLILIGGTAQAQVADPTSLGVGARALGMGRTYVAVAEDADALFMNPAGLATSGNPKLSTMYGSLMGDVNYAVIGGVYPFGEKSAIGAGFINASTSDIMLMNSDGSSAGAGRWGSSVMFLSAGTALNQIKPFSNIKKDILIGASFKYFSTGGTGSNDVASLEDAAGTGYSADLGILYPATEYLNLGLNLQNVLGSKVLRTSGVNEDLPMNIKVGGRICLLGRDGESYTIHNQRRLYLNADYDMPQNGRENITHLGMEFWPTGSFALRTGLDGSNLTAGVGIRLAGLELNYAYHPFGDVQEDATHFFSIGYLGEALQRVLEVQVDTPSDKAVIYDDNVKVSGRVNIIEGDPTQGPAGGITVKIDGVNIAVAEDNTFSANIPVDKVGKKLLEIEAQDTAGDRATAQLRLVRLVSFDDVPEGYWAKSPIENTGTVGLIEGYPDKTFRPERTLTRAELATLLVRARGLDLPQRNAVKVFNDVPATHWAAKYIEVAKREGLVTGYPGGAFKPNKQINKAEGIAVLARFENLRMAAAVYDKPFADVKANFWAARYIQAAKDAGMLKQISRNNYLYPTKELPRAEAVKLLSTTGLASEKIDKLFDWGQLKTEAAPSTSQVRAAL